AQGQLATSSAEPEMDVRSEHGGDIRNYYTTAHGRTGHVYYPLIEQIHGYNRPDAPFPRPTDTSVDALYQDSMLEHSFSAPNWEGSQDLGQPPYQTSDYFLEHELHNELNITQSTSVRYVAPYEQQRVDVINRAVAPYNSTIAALIQSCP